MTECVTVAIPVYNGAAYLGEAMASVLDQTYGDLRLVVLDNCSTDATVDVVATFDDPRVELVRNDENLGATANWNKALTVARGAYFKLVCADDLLSPRCLERQVAALDAPEHSSAVMVTSRRDIVGPDGAVLMAGRGLAGMRGLVSGRTATRRAVRAGGNPFGEPGTVLLRSTVLAQVGAWDGSIPYLIDVDFWYRVLEHGDVVAIDESLCAFRVHPSSWSNDLVGQQALQVREFFQRAHRRRPDIVRRSDVLLGTQKARVDSLGRRVVYRRLRVADAG